MTGADAGYFGLLEALRWGPSPTLVGRGLHEIVAGWARATPTAVAVVHRGRRTSYAELDETATAWASALARADVGPGTIVPVSLPRGLDLVTSLLAVLKLGAAYAVLDPAAPAPRIAMQLAQLAPPVLVASARSAASRPGPGVPVWPVPDRRLPPTPSFRPRALSGDEPCCVFFTSGTTGAPKAVLTSHDATSRLFGAATFAEFGASRSMPLAAPTGWDAFSLELWSALLTGGTSVVIEEPYLSSQALRAAVAEAGVNVVWLTSSLFAMLVEEDLGGFVGLCEVFIGGERVSAPHVREFMSRHPDIGLVNGYGPVESTVFATTHRLVPADCAADQPVPIGLPVPGTAVVVLDGERVCGPGELGEIHLSGTGLAAGYLGDAELTAQRFPIVTDPAHPSTPIRLYRTGDLGFRDEAGVLHFRGRADRLVKVRGHRVEPAEVEQQLEELLDSVRRCRVVAQRDAGEAVDGLVAFCIPVLGGDPLSTALEVARAHLPAHQVPRLLVSVPSFPLTAQGKVDERRLLAGITAAAIAETAGLASPRSALSTAETRPAPEGVAADVTAVLREVLGLDEVSLERSFFELGGDSLSAGRMCARLAARLARPIPISWI